MLTMTQDKELEQTLVPPKSILIIDDEEMIQVVLRACLEDLAGWKVLIASSGREGLAMAMTANPDAIMLDVMMPGMDGVQFLQRLQANMPTRDIPVILLTAKSDLINPKAYLKVGAIGAIAKPFDPIPMIYQAAAFLGWEIASSKDQP
jgi:CheY-like chemotaxis protein